MDDGIENLEAMGLRERKKIETRRAIRKQALNLALAVGLENLTVEAIAEASGISARTFFNYFETKEDALVSDFPAAIEVLGPLLEKRDLAESPLDSVIAVIREYDPFSLATAERDVLLARHQLIQQHPTLMGNQLAKHALMERELASMLADRYGVDVDEDMRPSLLAAIVLSAVRVAQRRWVRHTSASLKELMDEGFTLLKEGFLNETGAHHE